MDVLNRSNPNLPMLRLAFSMAAGAKHGLLTVYYRSRTTLGQNRGQTQAIVEQKQDQTRETGNKVTSFTAAYSKMY
ncbi:hypothetical protein EXN66_Car003946 [Channa argus]|uniref:Uncharacterized protein n=1 Tax=Channa argus TaxID=215402 RepID=A0A6G1PDR9_CHAAH|nr:hypothetical protein EXN66_Car003946 [Channa argus]